MDLLGTFRNHRIHACQARLVGHADRGAEIPFVKRESRL